MVLVSVLTPAFVLAALALCVAELKLKVLIALGIVLLIGLGSAFGRREDEPEFEILEPGEEPELQGIVDRLCVAADLPRPEIALADERQPNSWIVDPPGRLPRLYVTCGLLDLLEPVELEAVVAHELSHVAHRDATVMTVVGAPGAVLLHGGRADFGWWPPFMAARLFSFAIGLVASIGGNALSRYRELTADAGAAALTGRPSALASALLKVSGGLELVPSTDLRAVAARDGLHLLAVDDASGWRRVLGRTHPSVERRVAALERLEHRVAHARSAPPS